MEMTDRVVVWLRASDAARSFDEIHQMLEGHHRGLSALRTKETMRALAHRRFVKGVGKGRYRIGSRYAAPSEVLPSTVYEMPPPSARYALMLDEIGRMGGSASVAELFDRLKAKDAATQYGVVAEMLVRGVSLGDIHRAPQGRFTLGAPLPSPPETVVDPANVEPTDAGEATSDRVVEGAADHERRLEEMLAEKRVRLAALETERVEYMRVRAHLGELVAHNSASVDRVLQEIDELESMQQQLRRIAATLTAVRPAAS